MNAIVYILIAATICFTVMGNLLVKAGMLEVGILPGNMEMLPGFFFRAFTNLKVLEGLALALMAASTWIGAVSMSDISFAYPFMSLTIVMVLALSGVFFGEAVSLIRWVGVFIVCIGIFVASRG
jgi:drug/metabolite transporter (DMT)-like permease